MAPGDHWRGIDPQARLLRAWMSSAGVWRWPPLCRWRQASALWDLTPGQRNQNGRATGTRRRIITDRRCLTCCGWTHRTYGWRSPQALDLVSGLTVSALRQPVLLAQETGRARCRCLAHDQRHAVSSRIPALALLEVSACRQKPGRSSQNLVRAVLLSADWVVSGPASVPTPACAGVGATGSNESTGR